MTQPPTPPTPGFYPDGQGALRLWDGQRWTEVTRPMPQQPQQAPPQLEPKAPKNWFQRNIGWKLATLIAIAIGAASCGAIINAGGGDEGPATTAAVPASSEEPKPSASQPPTVQIGEKVRDDGYQFTVSKVTCGVKRVGDSYSNEKAQGQFCLVKLQVKNVSKEPINYSEENQALVDTERKTYSPDAEAWLYIDDSDPWGEINPGNTLKTTVPFDISKRTKPDYLLLKAGVFGFSEGVRVKL
jgi:hypothetical protein